MGGPRGKMCEHRRRLARRGNEAQAVDPERTRSEPP